MIAPKVRKAPARGFYWLAVDEAPSTDRHWLACSTCHKPVKDHSAARAAHRRTHSAEAAA